VNSVGELESFGLSYSRHRVCSPPERFVATAPKWCVATAHDHSILVDYFGRRSVADRNAAGGADAIVVAGKFGSEMARDEEVGRPTSWQGRVFGGGFEVHEMSWQEQVNAGDTVTPEYEVQFMYEEKPTRGSRDGLNQGRVVGAAPVSVASVSSVVRAQVRPIGEPALGVMGGLLQPVSSPAEPPVSSLSGSFANPSTTAPAPFGDVLAGDVSPLTYAARAAMEVVPSRPAAVSVLPRGRAGSANRNQHT
jgi:hypothetical protein